MKNIDQELVDWAIRKIKTEYAEDIALLIGRVGACKIPTDEQNMVFDFFVPATERGNQMAQTFVIEDMGYDLYPISWKRLEEIAALEEPGMIFAFDQGEVIYAKSEEEKRRYEELKEKLHKHLKNKELMFKLALEFMDTAMDIFKTMLFEVSLCKVRKAAGSICCYLMNAIASVNGTYLKEGYRNLLFEMQQIQQKPEAFQKNYEAVIGAQEIEEIKKLSYSLIKETRVFLADRKPVVKKEKQNIYYNDLADWYQEARYTFRQIAYYASTGAFEDCFLLGCYLQIEFDHIDKEFNLNKMDLLSAFNKENLASFAKCAKDIEGYILKVLQENDAEVKIYKDLDEFLLN